MLTSFTSRRSLNKGFTLPEVLITVLIMSVISSIVISGQSKYSDGTLLNNSTGNIALDLRQAQVYGVSVREFTPGEFSAGYGLSFSTINSLEKSAYISFADRVSGSDRYIYDGDWTCEKGGASECIEKRDLPNGYTFSSICQIPQSGGEDCSPARVDITFVRPETDAHIVFLSSSGSVLSFSSTKGVKITLISPNSLTRSIVVYSTGQVSVQ